MSKEKMYLVRREVYAKNIKEAMEKTDGEIYSIELADEKFQEKEEKLTNVGFNKK